VTLKFLLDTNIVSEPLRPTPNRGILDKLRVHQSECAIASIVWHELVYGSERLPKSAKRRAVEHYLMNVVRPTLPILAYEERAAQWHAVERARLAAMGKTPPFVDGQIASVAIINDLTLVTMNTRDFAHFTNLTVTNWIDPEHSGRGGQ
jgi:tRNA(fMet)-specific endonuclease VapC